MSNKELCSNRANDNDIELTVFFFYYAYIGRRTGYRACW